jgi:hypothetical protein
MESRATVLKKIWADPVWSKVIANAIWAALIVIAAALVAYFVGWWPSIASIASKIISLVMASTPVPNWLLVPVCLMALFGGYVLFVMLRPYRTEQDWRHYQEDTFFDVVWRWSYNLYNRDITDLTPFCQRCDTQLLPRYNTSMPYYHPYQTIYHCCRCDSHIEIRKNQQELLTDVSLEIQRKLRQMTRPSNRSG